MKMDRFENYCFLIKEKFEAEVHCVEETQLMNAREETATTRHTGLLQVPPPPTTEKTIMLALIVEFQAPGLRVSTFLVSKH